MKRVFLAAAVAALIVGSSTQAAPAGGSLLVIRTKVAAYAKWRPVYDAHQSARDEAGLTNCQVRSTVDNPNEVFVACGFADLAKAKAFTASKSLADAMRKAGVVGKPEFDFLGPPR
jgi:hypothetical protein